MNCEANIRPVIGELTALRQWTGAPREFWTRYSAALADLCDADRCVAAVRSSAENATWKKLQDWSHGEMPVAPNAEFNAGLIPFAETTASAGVVLSELSARRSFTLGLRLPWQAAGETVIVLLLVCDTTENAAREALGRLQLVSDIPLMRQSGQPSEEARVATERFAGVFEVLTQVNDQPRFFGAALGLCNALATRLAAERVSVGWLRNGAVRLQAISRMEKFNREMAAAQSLERAMEEAIDQEADLRFPAASDSTAVLRDHAKFSQEQSVPHLLTVSVRVADRCVGALTCERSAREFTESEAQQVQLAAGLVARRLSELERRDRSWPARCLARGRELSSALVGPRHAWAKVIGILGTLVLLALIFLRIPYRVEGNFSVRADELAYLSAPYESYLADVFVRPGDALTNGQPLVRLDTQDLFLEESSALADLSRYQREAEKARAARALADMRIAEALAQQSQARLDIVRHRLQQATVRAPFAGTVVEGDLRERLGAPVKQGDALLRMARLEGLYVVADVPERDVQELGGTETGEIAFLSQPRVRFPVRATVLEPMAVARDGANIFQLRCALQQPPEAWFRPGMTGVARMDVGKRRLGWILLHRTVDFIRLHVWW